jgi:hypothetical protein
VAGRPLGRHAPWGTTNTCDLSYYHSTHGEIVAFVLVSSTALHAGHLRPALFGQVRGTRQNRKDYCKAATRVLAKEEAAKTADKAAAKPPSIAKGITRYSTTQMI